MSRPKAQIPTYRLHRPSGRAVVTLTDGTGNRRDVYLGDHGTAKSKREYDRVVAELHSAPDRPVRTADVTVNEVAVAYVKFIDGYYGLKATEPRESRYSLRPVKKLYGITLAAEFGPRALKAVRQCMIDEGWSRGVINQRIGRIKRMFKWATSEELIPPTVFHGLQAVAGLGRGRTLAREPEPVKPVPDQFVEMTLPHVLPTVAAMIELQRLTGMRPGEVCQIRAIDIDTTGAVWLYRPAVHKTAWRNKDRVIPLGPKAQQIAKRYLTTDVNAYLFDPSRAMHDRAMRLRIARQSPVQPSQICRKSATPKKRPGSRYTTCSYGKAVTRGIELADAEERRLAIETGKTVDPDFVFVPHWHPNQLRHSRATEVRQSHGLEAAQATLGHSQAAVTLIYAERDLSLAIKVAAETG